MNSIHSDPVIPPMLGWSKQAARHLIGACDLSRGLGRVVFLVNFPKRLLPYCGFISTHTNRFGGQGKVQKQISPEWGDILKLLPANALDGRVTSSLLPPKEGQRAEEARP